MGRLDTKLNIIYNLKIILRYLWEFTSSLQYIYLFLFIISCGMFQMSNTELNSTNNNPAVNNICDNVASLNSSSLYEDVANLLNSRPVCSWIELAHPHSAFIHTFKLSMNGWHNNVTWRSEVEPSGSQTARKLLLLWPDDLDQRVRSIERQEWGEKKNKRLKIHLHAHTHKTKIKEKKDNMASPSTRINGWMDSIRIYVMCSQPCQDVNYQCSIIWQ